MGLVYTVMAAAWALEFVLATLYLGSSWPDATKRSRLYKACGSILFFLYGIEMMRLTHMHTTPQLMLIAGLGLYLVADFFICLSPLNDTPNGDAENWKEHSFRISSKMTGVGMYILATFIMAAAFIVSMFTCDRVAPWWGFLGLLVFPTILVLSVFFVLNIEFQELFHKNSQLVSVGILLIIVMLIDFAGQFAFGMQSLPFSLIGAISSIINALVSLIASMTLAIRTLGTKKYHGRFLRDVSVYACYAKMLLYPGALLSMAAMQIY